MGRTSCGTLLWRSDIVLLCMGKRWVSRIQSRFQDCCRMGYHGCLERWRECSGFGGIPLECGCLSRMPGYVAIEWYWTGCVSLQHSRTIYCRLQGDFPSRKRTLQRGYLRTGGGSRRNGFGNVLHCLYIERCFGQDSAGRKPEAGITWIGQSDRIRWTAPSWCEKMECGASRTLYLVVGVERCRRKGYGNNRNKSRVQNFWDKERTFLYKRCACIGERC